MYTPDSLRSRELTPATPHQLAALETRDLARTTLASLDLVDARRTALATVRQHMDLVLNPDAPRDPVQEMVAQALAVNKLLTLVGRRRKVTGMSALGSAVIENKGSGNLQINVAGNGVNYEFTVNSDGGIEGGPSTTEVADVGAGQMDAASLVRIVDSLKNLVASN